MKGLLELRPRFAHQDMIVVRRRAPGNKSERVIPVRSDLPTGYERTTTTYRTGSVYLETDKGERRAFGSYYTPDHIVNHIVNASIGLACRDVENGIRRDLAALDAQIAAAPSEQQGELGAERQLWRLLLATGCCGSGYSILRWARAILIRACQYLAEEMPPIPTHAILELQIPRKVTDRLPTGSASSLRRACLG